MTNKLTTKRLEIVNFRVSALCGHNLSSLASLVSGTSAKNVEKNVKIPKTSERFLTLPKVSERVQMHPSRSEQVPACLRSYENLENLAKTSRKLRETRASVVVNKR